MCIGLGTVQGVGATGSLAEGPPYFATIRPTLSKVVQGLWFFYGFMLFMVFFILFNCSMFSGSGQGEIAFWY